jgi:glyoxylase-like metal-dependent hydrolase (beta-lactamase superfamily II)
MNRIFHIVAGKQNPPMSQPDAKGENHRISRRHFVVTAAILTTGKWLAPGRLLAADESIVVMARKQAANANITTQVLRRNLAALIGSGGNIAVLTGSDGKLLVDAGYSSSQAKIADALGGLDPRPVKHLINTHWHFDHTDGNEWIHAKGASILAHTNTRKHLSTTTRVEAWDYTFPPAPAGAIPSETFEREQTLHLNDSTIMLSYYGPAHTDGDISAYFAEADVLHCGDTWWNGHYPFIDYSTGGHINGLIKAADTNVSKATDKTIIIPGHGKVGGKAELIEYRDMLVTIRDRVAALKKQGKTLEEVIAAKPTAAYDAKWATKFTTGAVFAKYVYQGV